MPKFKLDAIELQDDDIVLMVSFSYSGPKDGIPSENEDGTASEETIALSEAEEFAQRRLFRAGFNFRHAYAWPDGSLYLYVLMKLGRTRLEMLADIERSLNTAGNKRDVYPSPTDWQEIRSSNTKKFGGWEDVKRRFAQPWNSTFRVDKFVNEIAAQATK